MSGMPINYSPGAAGCTQTDCGSQNTVTVDGVCGRRCGEHPPEFQAQRAVEIAVELGPDSAAAYVRTDLR